MRAQTHDGATTATGTFIRVALHWQRQNPAPSLHVAVVSCITHPNCRLDLAVNLVLSPVGQIAPVLPQLLTDMEGCRGTATKGVSEGEDECRFVDEELRVARRIHGTLKTDS